MDPLSFKDAKERRQREEKRDERILRFALVIGTVYMVALIAVLLGGAVWLWRHA